MILVGDAADCVAELEPGSIQTCVTSPPYWGLRDYGVEGQLGCEPTLAEYVARVVSVFEVVRRALTDDGTLWLNLGDTWMCRPGPSLHRGLGKIRPGQVRHVRQDASIKMHDLVGVPWSVAFALRDAGWYLRSEVVWSKSNPMPESVKNRPTKAHEQVFLLTKTPSDYYWDEAASSEPATWARNKTTTRRSRSVIELPTQPSKHGHPAPMPLELARRLMLATSRPGDRVLDCFAGSGTTGEAALQLGRVPVLVELNPSSVEIIKKRLATYPLPLRFAEGCP